MTCLFREPRNNLGDAFPQHHHPANHANGKDGEPFCDHSEANYGPYDRETILDRLHVVAG